VNSKEGESSIQSLHVFPFHATLSYKVGFYMCLVPPNNGHLKFGP